ncbi:adenine deaminase [Criblamydia sequanensis]|uniref:Adenine deaminase n=1 Tax=Candidatus Criblamydia sequanensis CRIB-18 TaxID=1437425 RepID=A0A090D132_9BACT|nr:adenine deaminase [Criblamydia sequanensis]CDR33303.1 Adenine deaminase [Criblamydia sequanensis CRIB-18]
MTFKIQGNVVDIVNLKIFPAEIKVENGIIAAILPLDKELLGPFILPGFVDAHVHIESSMLVPSEFARLAVKHGTVATVSDPHEIANVLGIPGVRYMVQNGKEVLFNFCFGAPSCVPATPFETAGAKLDVTDLKTLFEEDHLSYLSEMMNYPGVLAKDEAVLAKINLAKQLNLQIDGHAPLVRGKNAKEYFSNGITTDHECSQLEEGLEKANLGVNILIREGSAAKNFEALHPLIRSHPEKIMFCSDDKHPDDLLKGHINEIVKRALRKGYNLMDVLRIASLNPIRHYGLKVGLLQAGDSADFIVVDNLTSFDVKTTVIKGIVVFDKGVTLMPRPAISQLNNFDAELKDEKDFAIKAGPTPINVIKAFDGELITDSFLETPLIEEGCFVSDTKKDLLKLAVVNRYKNAKPAIAFIQGFGFKEGAIASSVAHDSHNIIAVGVNDSDLKEAVNAVIRSKGGVAVASKGKVYSLALPVAGLMSDKEGDFVAKEYEALNLKAKALGSSLASPFMTLSFMALLVIPKLKLSDFGLFDVDQFKLV